MSDDGECMLLHRSIPIQKSVEQWLRRLQESIAETIRSDIHLCIKDIDNGVAYEELVSKVFLSSENFFLIFGVIVSVYMSSIISWIALCMDTRS